MRSLRAREFAAIAVAVLAAVGVTVIVAVVLVRRSAEREALRSLARQVALIAAEQRSTPASGSAPSLGVFFQTQQERLAILTESDAALLLPPAGGAALRAGRPAQGSVLVGGRDYLYAARSERGRAVVLLRPSALAAADLHPFTIAFLVAAGAGALIAALAAPLLAGAVARPITQVVNATRALAAGERPGRIPERGLSEVASLAAAFNQMADDLDRTRESERSFLLSVSHELKTPLAAIRGHGEALLDGVIAVPKAAGIVVAEAQRLERLVRDLLDLARLNQHTFTIHPRELDLGELAAQAHARHEAEADRIGVALRLDAAAPAPAFADPDRGLQVLSNLVENALRMTPAGGAVTIAAAPGRLRVADSGPGLEPQELGRAFERFYLYRRYAAHRAVGTGLGLAIVKELTASMEGTVTVESTPGVGTVFEVRLPRARTGATAAMAAREAETGGALVGRERTPD